MVALADAMKQERAMSEMNLIEVTFRSYAMMAKEEKSASGECRRRFDENSGDYLAGTL
jgi:hypothetical protein